MGYGIASKKHPKTFLLSAAEEVELAQVIEVGGDSAADAKRRFVRANVGLAISMATKFRAPQHVSRDDMIQDAMVGLEQAVVRFDWRRGYRFSTYAGWWIRQSIQQGLENTAAPVRIPVHRTQELHGALRAAGGDLTLLPPALSATLAISAMGSFDASASDASETGGESVLLRTNASATSDPVDEVIASHERECVAELVASLNHTSRYAIVRRFGLDGQPPVTFSEIGVELGVSAEAARRRVLRSLEALRPAAALLASSEPDRHLNEPVAA